MAETIGGPFAADYAIRTIYRSAVLNAILAGDAGFSITPLSDEEFTVMYELEPGVVLDFSGWRKDPVPDRPQPSL